MSFPIALSGLNAASADLSVTAHNVSNAATLGFKEGRIEFAEVYQSGVRVADTRQQFTPGNIEFTGNSLDLAISGDGFFTVSDNGSLLYSRAGAFGVDPDGFVVNSAEQRLQVYPPQGTTGVFDTGALQDLRLTIGQSAPNQTSTGELGVNLPANSPVPTSPVFDPTDPGSFNHSTSTTVYDSLGESHNASWYFVKDPAANTWNSYLYIDGAAVGGATQMEFDANGALSVPAGGFVTYPAFDPGTGADPLNMQFDMNGSTQYGGDFAVNNVTQDGYATGRLTGIDIDQAGVVLARFTNGVALPLGQVALTRFPNQQGLQPEGDNTWAQTFASGDALRGAAGTANFGLVQAGALEQSNVDLTSQLVNMIIAQRNFQANAQMISTEDAITQTIINLR
jgi:flagellar hook protein FlgE